MRAIQLGVLYVRHMEVPNTALEDFYWSVCLNQVKVLAKVIITSGSPLELDASDLRENCRWCG